MAASAAVSYMEVGGEVNGWGERGWNHLALRPKIVSAPYTVYAG